MPLLGLIGFPLSHSFSPNYFKNKFEKEDIKDWSYQAFPLESIDLFPKLWKDHPDLIGLNVTIPYKEKVIPYLDDLDESVKELQVVNTIKKQGNKLIGYNTDTIGFEISLCNFINNNIKNFLYNLNIKALILGTGGAAKAVAFVLDKLSIKYKFVSRKSGTIHLNYKDLDKTIIHNHQLIINTTPLGTYPKINTCPDIPYLYLSSKHFLFDLTYNPAISLFLKLGNQQGASTLNGLNMLELQAESSWQIWQ